MHHEPQGAQPEVDGDQHCSVLGKVFSGCVESWDSLRVKSVVPASVEEDDDRVVMSGD